MVKNINRWIEAQEESSMLNWYLKINQLGIPMPKTNMYVLKKEEVAALIELKLLRNVIEAMRFMAREIGYPVFIKTDLYSGKHLFKDTCYVEHEKDLATHLIRLIEEMECVNIISGLPLHGLIVREFIELDWRFKAFHGLPIAPERRYLIKNHKVITHFSYWPEDAIRFYKGTPEPKNWRELLREMDIEDKTEVALLTGYSNKVAGVMNGFWSVDFARGRDGIWYLIDMARGEVSWIPESVRKEYDLPEF